MSNNAFVFMLSVGSALIALWVHARFPKLAPEMVGKTLLHTMVASALLGLMPGAVESPVLAVITILLLVVPALTYALLCSIWSTPSLPGECQRVAGLDPAARALTAGELDDGLRAAAAGRLPGAKVVFDVDHDQIAVEEDGVDREPHEEHVNRAGGAEQDSLTGWKAAPAEQPPHSLRRARRHEQMLADDAPVLAGQNGELRSQRGCGLRGRAAGTTGRRARAVR